MFFILRFRYYIFLFIYLFAVSPIFGQNANDDINLDKINYKLIEEIFSKKLNQLRSSNKCESLSQDKILAEAALDQSNYMLTNNYVGHDQKQPDKANPQLRVFYYKGTHDLIGENCIKIYLKRETKPKGAKKVEIYNTYEQAANALYTGWKNSSGHYKNMIKPEYDNYGLGFSFNKDSSALYVAQVFAAKPYLPKREFESPSDAYGIKNRASSKCDCFLSYPGHKMESYVQIVLDGDSVFLRSENLKELKSFFNKKGDAYYLDIVLRDQFVCSKNNLLHGSPIFDGTMLKPVLFADIFKNNRAKDGKNLYSPVSKIPDIFKNQIYNVNSGFIKEGYGCTYSWSHSVPSMDLDLLNLFPKWLYEEGAVIKPDTFNGELNFTIPFERNKTNLNTSIQNKLIEKLKIYNPFMTDISIKTFSSVEGSTEGNLKLQEKRANEILNVIKTSINKSANVNVQAKENWEDFYKQINHTPFEGLKNLTQDEVKQKLKDKKYLDSLDFILKKTRSATVSIKLHAVIDNNSSADLVVAAYKKAIDKGDSLQAFNCQQKLLEAAFNKGYNMNAISGVDIPVAKKNLKPWTNYLAMAVQDTDLIYSYESRIKILMAEKIDTNFLPLQFNFSILALKFLGYYGDTLIPIPKLYAKMQRTMAMRKNKLDSILIAHQFLNFHILSVYNHRALYQFDKIDKHLLEIKKYYPSAQITEEEAWRLGLMFNRNARYSWTLELLLPYLRNDTKNEELTFLLIQTYANGFLGSLGDDEWIKYLKRAKQMNPVRFREWIDKQNFQYMRIPLIKKEFCEK